MKRLVALALTAAASLLSGCATYDDYSYYDRDGYYEDDYYGNRDDSRRYYYDEYGNRVYGNPYDVASRYGANYGSASWGYPDYIRYNSYYSALWPTYRYYYDPYWSPGFYYGVTYFPRTYFGLNLSWYSWPYYQAYSPYRNSYGDHYYDWRDDYSRSRAGRMQQYGQAPRYGSARNEAQYLARTSGARGAAQTYYGASTQPGGIIDPIQARQTRARGGSLPFERNTRDWNVDPYGPDGRGYGGFTGQGTPTGRSSGEQLGRGSSGNQRSNEPAYQGSAPTTRSSRGYDRGQGRNDGDVAPVPNGRSSSRDSLRDQRFEPSQEIDAPETHRVYRGRTNPGSADASSREFMPQQTREPYNPIFEPQVEQTPQLRSQPQYEPRTREVYRSREIQQRQTYQPSEPVERNYSRQIDRSEPTMQRSEPRYERSAPTMQRSEPRSAPSYERSQPSESRSAPSSSSSDDDSGSSRSSRGQLGRIIHDDDD